MIPEWKVDSLEYNPRTPTALTLVSGGGWVANGVASKMLLELVWKLDGTLRAALVLGWMTVSAGAAPLPPIRTVFVILMENESLSSIKGNPSAPFINTVLLPQASHCEQYYAIGHPSLPNYLWLEAGTAFGITNDDPPSVHSQPTTNHLVSLLNRAGISWRAYEENISGAVLPLVDAYPYAVRHNPFVYFQDVTGTNNPSDPYGIAHVRPYSELARDLASQSAASYNFITPNVCSDMHDSCPPLSNPILQGDTWLSEEIPKIMNSSAYTNNGAIFVVWDEGSSTSTIGMIVLSPLARGNGYSSSVMYTHSSMLRTVQEIFHVTPLLGDAANAANLSDLFRPSVSPPTNLHIVGP
jgi:phosphatidylinositol-3-phosphatase